MAQTTSDATMGPGMSPDRLRLAVVAAACLGGAIGLPMGQVFGGALLGMAILAGAGAALAWGLVRTGQPRGRGTLIGAALFGAAGLLLSGPGGLAGGIVIGAALAALALWLRAGGYRRGLPGYASRGDVVRHTAFHLLCALVFVFLIAPILIVIPLSFNAESFFTFTPGMLSFDPDAYSLRHYRDFFTNSAWQQAMWNSIAIAPAATALSVILGTLAAVGLSQSHVPFRRTIMAVLISPMIVPLIISAAGMYFFYSRIGLQGTWIGVVLAHAALGIPFVIITVTATLVGFDRSLTRAAASLGAGPVRTFFRVQMPLILPGVVSGGLFAFITSFDEVVVVLFVGSASQKTLPWQMFIGLREQISPTILAVATMLVAISILLLATVEILRRRSERMRGMSPG